MVSLSYKEFMEEARMRLDEFSKEDLQTLILQWASNERPSNREDFLTKLAVKEGKPLISHDDEALIEEIEAFSERVEAEDYVDGFGWDPEILDEREFGDESWAEEMDDFFLEARELLKEGKYEVAEKAYRKLFKVLEMGDEGLPGTDYPGNMLDVDEDEHRALFYRSVYMNTDLEERADKLYDAMDDDDYTHSSRTKLKDVRDSLDAPLPDFHDFWKNGLNV